ncbi:MAG: hypothetical protein ACLP9L_41610 [Thermoguttaceae bacterium]
MHDANGHPLKVGDKVLIPCDVVGLSGPNCPDYCNVMVTTTLGRRPDGQKESFSAINTAQLVKVSGGNVNLNL